MRKIIIIAAGVVLAAVITGCRTMNYEDGRKVSGNPVMKLPEERRREQELKSLEGERERLERAWRSRTASFEKERSELERRELEEAGKLEAYIKELEGVKARRIAELESVKAQRMAELESLKSRRIAELEEKYALLTAQTRARRTAEIEKLMEEIGKSDLVVLAYTRDSLKSGTEARLQGESRVIRQRREDALKTEIAGLEAELAAKKAEIEADGAAKAAGFETDFEAGKAEAGAESVRRLDERKAGMTDFQAEYRRLEEIQGELAAGHGRSLEDIERRRKALEGIVTVPVEETLASAEFAAPVTEQALGPEVIRSGAPAAEPKKAAGRESVLAANSDGTEKPGDSAFAALVYEYNENKVYEVYTQPLRTTDIFLEPGETIVENPFISDSDRWIIGAGVSFDSERRAVQHVYIKPKEKALTASLVVNTDRRVYHLLLKSYADMYMPIVKWRYTLSSFPYNIARPASGGDGVTPAAGASVITQEISYVDPRYLSFDYKVTYSLFSKPKWLPGMVYDDGKKTYIVFNEIVLQSELPAIFENRGDIINYRVNGELVIIDKLVEKVTIKYRGEKVTVEKKRG